MKRSNKCLLKMADDERNAVVLLRRLGQVRDNIKRAAGVIRKIDDYKLHHRPTYWIPTVHGWCDQLQLLANELTIIETGLAAKIAS